MAKGHDQRQWPNPPLRDDKVSMKLNGGKAKSGVNFSKACDMGVALNRVRPGQWFVLGLGEDGGEGRSPRPAENGKGAPIRHPETGKVILQRGIHLDDCQPGSPKK